MHTRTGCCPHHDLNYATEGKYNQKPPDNDIHENTLQETPAHSLRPSAANDGGLAANRIKVVNTGDIAERPSSPDRKGVHGANAAGRQDYVMMATEA